MPQARVALRTRSASPSSSAREGIEVAGRPTTMKTASVAPALAPTASSVVERARRGDQEAFAALVRHYDRGLRALAYRLVGDRDRIDDALQEAYVNAFRALPRFRGDSDLGTWLYRIAYNACLDELERSRKVVHLPLAEVADMAQETEPVERLATRDGPSRWRSQRFRSRNAPPCSSSTPRGSRMPMPPKILAVPEGTVASRLNRGDVSRRELLTVTQSLRRYS
jgi:RNA polymerase sigma-70 factor, ECF subfamily